MERKRTLSILESPPEALPPTALDLFRFKDPERVAISETFSRVSELLRVAEMTEKAVSEFRDESQQRVNRIMLTAEELTDNISEVTSSRTYSVRYLAIHDELSQKGISEQEIFNFFITCVKAYKLVGQFFIDPKMKDDSRSLKMAVRDTGKQKRMLAQLNAANFGERPKWFKLNETDWKNFVIQHCAPQGVDLSTFAGNLDETDIVKRMVYQYIETGYLLARFKPDWFEGEAQNPPQKEEVKGEFEDDTVELESLIKQIGNLDRSGRFIKQMVMTKWLKWIEYLRKRKAEIVSEARNLSELVMILKLRGAIPVFDQYSPKELSQMTDNQFKINAQTVQAGDKAFEIEVDKYCQEPRIEIVSLWLERKLKEGNIASDLNEAINDYNGAKMDIFLGAILDQNGETADSFRKLKETDKKAYSVFNFDFKPIFSLLSGAELVYLRELVNGGGPLEPIVWEAADLISRQLSAGIGLPDKIVDEIKKNGRNWLKNNWRFAASVLEQELYGKPVEAVSQVSVDEAAAEDSLGDLEKDKTEFRSGNLAGWTLRYTLNRSLTNENQIEEIGGTDIDEREKAFEDFILKNDITCSIKPGSVIRTLEWLVTVPEEIENRRIRKTIGDAVFKKIKRGAVRIFYSMDPAQRKITFFVHQKQAMSYGF